MRAECNLLGPSTLDWCKQTLVNIHLDAFTTSIAELHDSVTLQFSTPNWVKRCEPYHPLVVWSIRKTSQSRGSKSSWDAFTTQTESGALISQEISHTPVGVIQSSFWRFAVGQALMKIKHGAIPILILKPLVKVNKGSARSVLDYKACQESLFRFLKDFKLLV